MTNSKASLVLNAGTFTSRASTVANGQIFTVQNATVNLIGGTTTKSGLTVKALLDKTTYEPGKKITDDEMRALRLKPHTFHGDWNYTLEPRKTS